MEDEKLDIQTQLNTIVDMLEGNPDLWDRMRSRVSLYRPDGSINYASVLRVLNSPEFENFRQQNPEIVSIGRRNVAAYSAIRGLQTSADIAKMAFGIHQFRKAKRVDDRAPQYPNAPRRNQSLQRAISDAQGRVTRGRTASQRNLDRQEDDQMFRAGLESGSRFSGGQAASAQAAAQQAYRTSAQQRIRRGQLDQQERQRGSEMVSRLIAQQMNEDARLQRFGENRFRNYDMPIWQARSLAKERLMQAGIKNAFGGINPLLSNLDDTMLLFRDEMPGYIDPNDLIAEDSGDYSEIFNSPILRMNTRLPAPVAADLNPRPAPRMPSGPFVNEMDTFRGFGGEYLNSVNRNAMREGEQSLRETNDYYTRVLQGSQGTRGR